MNKKRHKEALIALHKELHTSLDKLSACYISTNVKNSYGRDRYLISPVSGTGEIWVEAITTIK